MGKRLTTDLDKAISELRRERLMRRQVYPKLTSMGKLHPDKAQTRNERLDLAIKILEGLRDERAGTQSELFTE